MCNFFFVFCSFLLYLKCSWCIWYSAGCASIDFFMEVVEIFHGGHVFSLLFYCKWQQHMCLKRHRLRLENYGWCHVFFFFLLPKGCLKRLEQLCNPTIWKGVPRGARGAKVVWESVCTSKRCGGLGLRHFSDWNRVLGLKLIWLLFTSVGSHPMNLL